MSKDKVKQIIGLFGGFLSAILLFLGTINIRFEWFTAESIDAFVVVLTAGALLCLSLYGSYKNSYIITNKAKEQERHLKEKGLK